MAEARAQQSPVKSARGSHIPSHRYDGYDECMGWSRSLEEATGHTAAELRPTVLALLKLRAEQPAEQPVRPHGGSASAPLTSVFDRYSKDRHGKVALKEVPDSPKLPKLPQGCLKAGKAKRARADPDRPLGGRGPTLGVRTRSGRHSPL